MLIILGFRTINTATSKLDLNTKELSQGNTFHFKGVISLAAGHALHDTYTAFLPPLLPVLINKLTLTMTSAGLLSVFLQIPSLIQPGIGHLADRRNLRYVVIIAPAISAILMSLIGVTTSYALLVLFLLLVGISSAGFHAIGPVITGYISGSYLGKGMSYWMVGGELGRTFGPIIVVSAILHLTIDGMPWLMLAGLFASFILYLQIKNIPSQSQFLKERVPWRTALSKMKSVFVPLIFIIIVRSFMLSAVTIYLPTFLTSEGSDFWIAGASLTILQAAGVIGTFISGSVSDYIGRALVLKTSFLFSPLLMFLLLSINGMEQLLILVFLGFFTIAITPVIMALVQESFPESRALANGIYMSLSFLIRSGAIVLLGAIGDWVGLRYAFAACAILMLLGIPILFLLPQKQRLKIE